MVGPSCTGSIGKGAAVYTRCVWDVELLKVFVMNPEVLDHWSYKQSKITVATILEWANSWNPNRKDAIPIFAEEQSVKRAHIRIKLSGLSKKIIIPTYIQ